MYSDDERGCMRNPFEVFGLTPDMVGTLSEKDLFSVLKAMYRALQKIVHPDMVRRCLKKGIPDRAVELNLAFELLNLDKKPESFRHHRKNFVARRPSTAYRKSQALERALAAQVIQREQLATAYLNRLLSDYGWGGIGESDSAADTTRAYFPLRNVRLGLLDVAVNHHYKTAASWSIGSNYKEINLDASGYLSIRGIGRSHFSRAAYIHLLGSVPATEIELLPLLERSGACVFKAPALTNSIVDRGAPGFLVSNRINFDKFKKHILIYLRPMITERSYLFSLNRPEFEETGCLTLEGLVVKVNNSNYNF